MRRFWLGVVLVFLISAFGCATMMPSPQMNQLAEEVSELKEQVAELAEMVEMGGYGATAANFYPFSGDLNGGGGASDLDKITGTVQGDTAIGAQQGHSVWGNSLFVYSLHEAGNLGDQEPFSVDSAENEDWRLLTIYNSTALIGAPGGDGAWSGTVITNAEAGENISLWDPVFLNASDHQFHQADANAPGEWPCWGIAVHSVDGTWPAADGDLIWILTEGFIQHHAWSWSDENVKLYLGEAVSTITETAPSDDGDCIQPIGRVMQITNDVVYFRIDPINDYYEKN